MTDEPPSDDAPEEKLLRGVFGDLWQPSPAEITPSDSSFKEEIALKKGINLEDRQALNAINQLTRKDKFNIHLHRISVFFLYLVVVLVAILLIALVANMVLPPRLSPITPEQASKIYEFLFTGVSGGLFTKFSSKYLTGSTEETDKRHQ